ncbi:ABC transporter permease [Aliibacillus thermotolerans]|uniref:ABC transporter permease n=1 Tax=Aliibacillus thermotolerans TaxID=1834418 RepID=A0ABW0U5K6_9BACI|nr:ABC transporter permease [Aliibacillus thermotolerans]
MTKDKSVMNMENRSLISRIFSNKTASISFIFILCLVFIAVIGPYLTVYDPNVPDTSNRLASPSAKHFFGTDHHGRDIFTRIIHGMPLSLYIGVISVLIGATIGVVLGMISGYYGGFIDSFIMRCMDVLFAFPGILLALALVSVLGNSLHHLILAVSIFLVPMFARIVRSSTLAICQLEYIDAMKVLGASDIRIIFKHIFPNIVSPIIVQATLSIASAILTASTLSFLGLGVQPPTPEWGAMLNEGKDYMYQAPHVAFFPGLAIMFVVLVFHIFGDGLRDVLDPKSKK